MIFLGIVIGLVLAFVGLILMLAFAGPEMIVKGIASVDAPEKERKWRR